MRETKDFRTKMYSIHPETGGLVTHSLPYDREQKFYAGQLDRYVKKGFTYDKPEMFQCETCGGEFPVTGRHSEIHVIKAPLASLRQNDGETVTAMRCLVEGCGQVCKGEFGLRSHMRSHT